MNRPTTRRTISQLPPPSDCAGGDKVEPNPVGVPQPEDAGGAGGGSLGGAGTGAGPVDGVGVAEGVGAGDGVGLGDGLGWAGGMFGTGVVATAFLP